MTEVKPVPTLDEAAEGVRVTLRRLRGLESQARTLREQASKIQAELESAQESYWTASRVLVEAAAPESARCTS